MPPRRTFAAGSVFIRPGVEGRPRERADRAGWVARLAGGAERGVAVAAEADVDGLRELVGAAGLPTAQRPVCMHPVDDLAAARIEAARSLGALAHFADDADFGARLP